jgi:hypothetical protein
MTLDVPLWIWLWVVLVLLGLLLVFPKDPRR